MNFDLHRIPYAEPFFPENSLDILAETFERGQISGTGSAINQIEKRITSLLSSSHVFAVSNGSAAIRLAFQGLGLTRETKVILPGWGFHVAANVAYSMGAQLEFWDVSETSWCMELHSLEELSNTKVHTIVVLVHSFGNCADLNLYKKLRDNPNIQIIEDAAEAFMSRFENKMLGTWFDVGTFSMHAAKTITTGEGGFLSVNRDDLVSGIKLLRNHGMSPDRPYFHLLAGDNYRLSNLLASIAIPQLEVIDEIIAKRLFIYMTYMENLQGVKKLEFLKPTDPDGFFPWGVCVRFRGVDRTFIPGLRSFLSTRGIDTRPGFTSATLLPYFDEMKSTTQELACSDKLSMETVLLPHYYSLSKDDVERVCGAIIEFLHSPSF